MWQDIKYDSSSSLAISAKILKEEESTIGVHLKGRYWTTSAWPPESPPIWFFQHLLKSSLPSCTRVEVEPLGEMNSFRERYLPSMDLSLSERAFQAIITRSLWSCVCYRVRGCRDGYLTHSLSVNPKAMVQQWSNIFSTGGYYWIIMHITFQNQVN